MTEWLDPSSSDIPRPPDGWWEQVPVLNELYKLLSSHDPVNWELARQVGTALAASGEEPVDASAAEELEAITRAAAVEAEAFCGLSEPTLPEVHAVSRAEWVASNIETFRFVMDPLAKKMGIGGALPGQIPGMEDLPPELFASMNIPGGGGPGQVLQQVTGFLMGLQTGFVLGYMGRSVIGQYELPLPSPAPGRLLYVVSNLEQMERDWELDPKQFRYWIALHEITHHLEFSKPWVQRYFRSQLSTLIDSLDFDPSRMSGAFEGLEMLDPERMAEALGDPDQLIRATWTPLSEDAVGRLQAFMTLAEGYATFVMDAVGGRVLSEHGRLREAMERRRQSLSPGDALLERLLGLELKRRQYEEGVAFCRYVAGVHDVDALNQVWANPESLPTTAELADPDSWIARVLG